MAEPKKPKSGGSPAIPDTEKFLAWLEGVPDPQERYRRATEELERHQQVVERLSSVRATAAADAYESGETVRALAERLGVSPSRVHQLIQDAKSRSTKETDRKGRPSGRKKGGSR
jgi:DNA-directed RNA polymerase specialized sigma24 family protein